MPTQSPRAEVIGALPHLPELQTTRRKRLDGELPTPDYKRIDDAAADEAPALEQSADVDAGTDGEMRRAFIAAAVSQAIDGGPS
jgi:methionine synthase II (cobalamin-independent)